MNLVLPHFEIVRIERKRYLPENGEKLGNTLILYFESDHTIAGWIEVAEGDCSDPEIARAIEEYQAKGWKIEELI